MGKQLIPASVASDISERAVALARLSIARRGWSDNFSRSMVPSSGTGKVGIRTTSKPLIYQNRGIAPFLMTSLEGKTVNIKGAGFFRVKGVGLPGMGYQNRKGNPIKGSIWREQRWRHPGIKPGRFIENAISQAILEAQPRIRGMVTQSIAHPDAMIQSQIDRSELERERRVVERIRQQGYQAMLARNNRGGRA